MTLDAARAKSLFLAASDLPDPAERAAYLDRECGANAELRGRVEALLRANDAAPLPPALAPVTTIDERPVRERPGMVIGPYKLMEQIGEGGMGLVFVAEQQHPVRRRVALKVIKPGMDSAQVVARFEVERQALALMDHQNIAKVLDAGTTASGRPYFVMELVHGVPITQYCDANQLTPRRRLELFVPVCHAIQHAHQKGVIHRDLKPSNVLVTMYDDKPVPKVIDFGVAKAIEQRLTEKTVYTQFGALVGTFEYMSPEQAELNAFGVDTRSDIYSLGVLLYELLTGTTPLDRPRLREAAYGEIVRLIKEEEPPRPSLRLSTSGNLPKIAAARKMEPAQLSRLVRGEIDWIVMKCLEKDRARRYETANGLARDVQRYLADEPVEACPPSAGYRLRKYASKHRAALLTATALAAMLLAGVVVSTWQAVRATAAQRQARAERDTAQEARAEEVAQRGQAEAEQERARGAEALATATNDFLLRDLLAQTNPFDAQVDYAQSPDKDLTMRSVLDRAAERIDGRFPDQPLVEAAIRQTIGEAYRGLADVARAHVHMEKALAIRRQQLGNDHPDTLMSQQQLALLYHLQGQYAKAEPLLVQTLEGRRQYLGKDHRDTLTTQNLLAAAYGNRQYAKAEALFLQTLQANAGRRPLRHAMDRALSGLTLPPTRRVRQGGAAAPANLGRLQEGGGERSLLHAVDPARPGGVVLETRRVRQGRAAAHARVGGPQAEAARGPSPLAPSPGQARGAVPAAGPVR
jgi:serine/threonine protein kinase